MNLQSYDFICKGFQTPWSVIVYKILLLSMCLKEKKKTAKKSENKS